VLWEDFPEAKQVQPRLAQLTRMCFTYLSMFYPGLERVWKREPGALRIPWYVDLFLRRSVDISDPPTREQLRAQRAFSTAYLTWLREVHAGSGGQDLALKPQLARSEAFPAPDYPEKGLSELHFPDIMREGQRRPKSVTDVWKLLCHNTRDPLSACSGLGFFQRQLFEVSR
jgi:hypothetical protein